MNLLCSIIYFLPNPLALLLMYSKSMRKAFQLPSLDAWRTRECSVHADFILSCHHSSTRWCILHVTSAHQTYYSHFIVLSMDRALPVAIIWRPAAIWNNACSTAELQPLSCDHGRLISSSEFLELGYRESNIWKHKGGKHAHMRMQITVAQINFLRRHMELMQACHLYVSPCARLIDSSCRKQLWGK